MYRSHASVVNLSHSGVPVECTFMDCHLLEWGTESLKSTHPGPDSPEMSKTFPVLYLVQFLITLYLVICWIQQWCVVCSQPPDWTQHCCAASVANHLAEWCNSVLYLQPISWLKDAMLCCICSQSAGWKMQGHDKRLDFSAVYSLWKLTQSVPWSVNRKCSLE